MLSSVIEYGTVYDIWVISMNALSDKFNTIRSSLGGIGSSMPLMFKDIIRYRILSCIGSINISRHSECMLN